MNKMHIAGHRITTNTVVGISLGSLASIVATVWIISGIGRPLFAADLQIIEKKIDHYQTSTTVQILNIRKAALQSELREAKRDLRRNQDDDDAAEDIDKIESEIAQLDADILCHRSVGCEVLGDT